MNSVPEQLVGRSSIFKPYPYARLPQSTSASIRLPALLAVAILGAVPVMVPTPTTPFLLISVLIPASTVAPSQLLLVGLLLSTDVVVSVRIASLSCEALLHVPVCHVLHSSCLLLIRLRKLPKGSLLQAHKLLGQSRFMCSPPQRKHSIGGRSVRSTCASYAAPGHIFTGW
eukprot:CAMPEP_0114326278 /NCGR_PEP_ID=MMETSP0059-20121206/29632_1 /TAXON_ID=36894 /ORGANISM="Pyramimonas parkeae, Strain CCMP726" /LENGTH=170 /DNA_ID=CAMNT_0001455227 /DNA_START=249 /DNA_END=758 /DNA_ORIENTATION=+